MHRRTPKITQRAVRVPLPALLVVLARRDALSTVGAGEGIVRVEGPAVFVLVIEDPAVDFGHGFPANGSVGSTPPAPPPV
jgi:hypothetical protein